MILLSVNTDSFKGTKNFKKKWPGYLVVMVTLYVCIFCVTSLTVIVLLLALFVSLICTEHFSRSISVSDEVRVHVLLYRLSVVWVMVTCAVMLLTFKVILLWTV